MLYQQFFAQNLHFAINLFAALVCFAVFWLYLDAWTNRKELKELLKWLGFLLLAVSFFISATIIEQSVLGKSLFGYSSDLIATILRLLAYGAIIYAQIIDPLQARPVYNTPEPVKLIEPTKPDTTDNIVLTASAAGVTGKGSLAAIMAGAVTWLPLVLVPAGLTVAILYWRRATTGLERHLRPIAIAFAALAMADFIGLASLLRGTDNPLLYQFVAPFGICWMLQQLVLLTGAIVLGRWVWQYLTKRFVSQLFMILTTAVMAIFLVTTVSFTFLLVQSIQKQALSNLGTANKVLGYAISSKRAEGSANAAVVAQSSDIAAATAARDHLKLAALTNGFLTNKQLSSLLITDDTGQVLVRADDPEHWGDSLSGDSLIRRALIGSTVSSISPQSAVLAPLVYLKTVAPIRNAQGVVVGVAETGLVLDNSFIDGIKASTGLDSTVYAGDIRSATTFLSTDGKSRQVGTHETNTKILDQVLKNNQTYVGSGSNQNRQYLEVYAPLDDVDNVPVGMILISQPESLILAAAGRSVEITFLVAALMMLLCVVPAYLVSKYLADQL